MSDFPFTEDVVLLNSGDTARKGHYVEFGLHPHPDGWIKPGMANPFNEIAQGREKGQRFRITVHLLADDETTTENVSRETLKGGPICKRAVLLCKRVEFQFWGTNQAWRAWQESLDATEAGAAKYIHIACNIESRAALDHDPRAAKAFETIERDFWAAQEGRTPDIQQRQLEAGRR